MNALRDLLAPTSMATRTVVAEVLAAQAPRARAAACRTLQRRHLTRLFDLAGDGPAMTRGDAIPADTPALTQVLHEGWNSLPLPRVVRQFQKPMYAPAGQGPVAGFNEGGTRRLLGPGYFVLRPSDSEHLLRGAWVVDYLQVPAAPVPAGWPDVQPNEVGLQRFVYAGTRDYMRKVCDGVLVGMPYRGDKVLGVPFTLCRQP